MPLLFPVRSAIPKALKRTYASGPPPRLLKHKPSPAPPHLLTLGELSVPQIQSLITSAIGFKKYYQSRAIPLKEHQIDEGDSQFAEQSLKGKSVALMFSKRSTRTRVATETSVQILGGHPMFLGSQDIQLGVNESLYDTTRVVSSMVDGIMARVGHHSEIETLAAHSSVPVINALSHLYHPTQILADLQTLLEIRAPGSSSLDSLKNLTVSWVGDSNNILNEMLVVLPRLGMHLQVATPVGYDLDNEVYKLISDQAAREGLIGSITYTNSPQEAIKGSDVVFTDTWISMGQEEETARRLKDFAGFQVTEELLKEGGANEGCHFMHCLPRHQEEVNDEVFYGDRSVVFQEAENRKWTILSGMHTFVGKWKV